MARSPPRGVGRGEGEQVSKPTPVDLYVRHITRQWPGWEKHPETVRAIAVGARALLAAERRRIRDAFRLFARDNEWDSRTTQAVLSCVRAPRKDRP